jgi:hypothetical protein
MAAQHVGLGRGSALVEREASVQHLDPRLRFGMAARGMQL